MTMNRPDAAISSESSAAVGDPSVVRSGDHACANLGEQSEAIGSPNGWIIVGLGFAASLGLAFLTIHGY